MITVFELRERVREWSLREDVVEKDYALGWLLWGIASHPILGQTWVFKGGTCLKKCYFETYRFSEDLDFTLVEGAPGDPTTLREIFGDIADQVYEASGIEIPKEQIRFEAYTTTRGSQAIEGRVYYRGPRRPGGDLPRVKIDLTADEVLVYASVPREVVHPYTDGFPEPPKILCYSLVEIFGEKLRALAERCLPRDVYDIVNIFRREDARGESELVSDVLREKCRYKEIAVPTFASIDTSPHRAELDSEWRNMLGHQLPELPPLDMYLKELHEVFNWLEGQPVEAPTLQEFPLKQDTAVGWTLPSTISTWGTGVPLETIRYAGVNRLCVDLGYHGSTRRIEPYSLRQTKDGNLVLYAVRRDTGEPRSYRVDRIESLRVTREPFTPVYPVEFWPTGSISAPPLERRLSVERPPKPRRSRTTKSGIRYVVQCSYCGKRFKRRDTRLGKHKTKGKSGYPCPGLTGFIVRYA